MTKNNLSQQIEREISKQLDEMDKRFDRSGWFYLVIVIIILFLVLYFIMGVFRPSFDPTSSNSATQEEISSLESRVESLEEELEALQSE